MRKVADADVSQTPVSRSQAVAEIWKVAGPGRKPLKIRVKGVAGTCPHWSLTAEITVRRWVRVPVTVALAGSVQDSSPLTVANDVFGSTRKSGPTAVPTCTSAVAIPGDRTASMSARRVMGASRLIWAPPSCGWFQG
jgi:hypothetical protein